MRQRHRWWASLLVLGLVAGLLAGCGGGGGGGSSAITGPTTVSAGASTAVIQGQVLTTRRTAAREPVLLVVLQTALGIGVAEAQNGEVPVEGATVTLHGSNGTTIATTQAHGTTVDSEPIVVGAGDTAKITGKVTQAGGTLTVEVEVKEPKAVVDNDAQLGHAINLAEASGRPLEEVIALREQGLGWGVIAKQLGVHPGVLGLGANVSKFDLEAARGKLGKGGGNNGEDDNGDVSPTSDGKGGGKGKGKGRGPKS